MGYQTGIITALRDWGLTVIEVPGWRTAGDDYFDPKGHVCHHDVVPDVAGTDDDIPTIIVNGRSDLPGPLANFWLETDGNVHLCAAGEANHAGEGGWRGLSGNYSVWGTEANNMGTPATPWPEVQLEAWYKLCAATCEFSGFSPAMVCGHKEWAPSRKVDPHSINMTEFRRKVAEAEKGGLTVADIDKLIAEQKRTQRTIQRQHKLDRKQQARLSQAEGRITKAQADKIIAAIDAEADED